MNFRDFKQLELQHRKRVQKTLELNGGFTDGDFESHRKFFQKNDTNDTGNVTQKAIRELLASLFPNTNVHRERHIRIGQLVKEADLDGNGIFNWEEFLTLMRSITEEMDRDILMMGLKLRDELGYSRIEVKQFRDLYRVCDSDKSG